MFQSDPMFHLKFYVSSHQPKVYNQSALQMIWHGFNMAGGTSSPIPLYYGNWQNILSTGINPRRRQQLWHLLSLARYVSFQPKYFHNLTQSFCHLVWLNSKRNNIFEMANIWGARGNNFRIWFNGQDFSANTASYPTQKINLTQRNHKWIFELSSWVFTCQKLINFGGWQKYISSVCLIFTQHRTFQRIFQLFISQILKCFKYVLSP